MHIPGGIDGQHQVVHPQAVALRIAVGVDARVQQLVIGGQNACKFEFVLSAHQGQHELAMAKSSRK